MAAISLQPITIYKGDSTNAFGVRVIRIKLTTEVSLVGATAKFDLLSFSKTFTNAEVLTKVFTIEIGNTQTKNFPLGTIYGRLTLFDASNRVMTAACNIPFFVRIPGGMAGGACRIDTGIAEITVEMGVDYSLAYNKPTINGVEVSGDKSGKDYGLNRIYDYNPQSTYAVGDQVLNDRSFFSCTTAITQPEVWNPLHWQDIGGGEGVANAVHYTEDLNKSPSEKTQARQNIGAAASADLSNHTADKQNPHEVTKAQVGLGNVDNTSDMQKPVSDDQQAALDLKVTITLLKAAFDNPSTTVKLSPASIKTYLQNLYDAIQAL